MGTPLVIVSLEGLPGAGKTTTARLLAQRPGIAYAHELSAQHPFIDAFYTDMERYKLETELCFVLLHYHQYRDLAAEGLTVIDFSPVKDLVFADLNLADADYRLFSELYKHLWRGLPVPDVALFFELDHEHTMQRIRERDRPSERGIDPDYLRRLRAAYQARFTQLATEVMLLEVTREQTPEDVAQAAAELLSV